MDREFLFQCMAVLGTSGGMVKVTRHHAREWCQLSSAFLACWSPPGLSPLALRHHHSPTKLRSHPGLGTVMSAVRPVYAAALWPGGVGTPSLSAHTTARHIAHASALLRHLLDWRLAAPQPYPPGQQLPGPHWIQTAALQLPSSCSAIPTPSRDVAGSLPFFLKRHHQGGARHPQPPSAAPTATGPQLSEWQPLCNFVEHRLHHSVDTEGIRRILTTPQSDTTALASMLRLLGWQDTQPDALICPAAAVVTVRGHTHPHKRPPPGTGRS